MTTAIGSSGAAVMSAIDPVFREKEPKHGDATVHEELTDPGRVQAVLIADLMDHAGRIPASRRAAAFLRTSRRAGADAALATGHSRLSKCSKHDRCSASVPCARGWTFDCRVGMHRPPTRERAEALHAVSGRKSLRISAASAAAGRLRTLLGARLLLVAAGHCGKLTRTQAVPVFPQRFPPAGPHFLSSQR